MTTPDTTLSTALTKLADDWDRRVPLAPEEELRALIADHPTPAPVSDTRRGDGDRLGPPPLCGAENADYPGEYACTFPAGHPRVPDPDDGPTMYDHAASASGAWWNTPAPVSDTRREDVARALFEHDQKAWPDSVSTWENIHQAERDAYLARADAVLGVFPARREVEWTEAACAWADYRRDHGIATNPHAAAHKAFMAGRQSVLGALDAGGVQR